MAASGCALSCPRLRSPVEGSAACPIDPRHAACHRLPAAGPGCVGSAAAPAAPRAAPARDPRRRRPGRRKARSRPSRSRATSASRQDTIRSYMLVQPGDPFDPDRLDRSLKTLFATGLFQDVNSRRDRQHARRQGASRTRSSTASPSRATASSPTTQLRGEVQLRRRAVFTPQLGAGRPAAHPGRSTPRRGRFAATRRAEDHPARPEPGRRRLRDQRGRRDAGQPHRLRRQPGVQRGPAARGDRQPRGGVGGASSPPPTSTTRSASTSTRSCCAASTSRTAMPISRSTTPPPSWRPTAAASS